MKRRFIYLTVILCMIISLVPIAISAPAVQAATTDVYAGSSIQTAINDATAGDTIIVHDGTYSESLYIDKPLTIISENGAETTIITVDDNNSSDGVVIECGGVTFGAAGQGFTVAGGGVDDWNWWGIGIPDESGDVFSGITIEGNTIYGFAWAINLWTNEGEISGCTITGNEIHNCDYGIGLDSDYGGNHGHTVSGNTIHDCFDSWDDGSAGIYLGAYYDGGYVYGITIENNDIYDCESHGIVLESTGGDIYGNTISNNDIYNCDDDGIYLHNDESYGDIYGNDILDNTIYSCDEGVVFYDDESGGEMRGNTVDNNEIHDCDKGIRFSSSSDDCVIDNTISNNDIYNCDDYFDSAGILLYALYDGIISGTAVDGNTVRNCSMGIELTAEDSGSLTGNTVLDNAVYQTGDYLGSGYGIYLYTYSSGDIATCTIQDNEIYGWDRGIFLHDQSDTSIDDIDILDNVLYNGTTGNNYGIRTFYSNIISIIGNDVAYSNENGIYLYESDYVSVQGNTVHNNIKGIYMEGCDTINIRGNDIRDNNLPDLTGIHIVNSYDVSANCNNIDDNGLGLYINNLEMVCVDAEDNWWGAASGPSGTGFSGSGDGIQVAGGCVYIDTWLAAELNLSAMPVVLDTEAVPSAVSLYDMLNYENEMYTLGPAYTDLIVEIGCPNNSCGIPAATVNLSALLLDLLPADFEEIYVSQWSDTRQEYWHGWLDYLSEMETYDYYSVNGTCFLDYELYLEDLFFNDYYEECMGDECDYCEPCYPCMALQTFFEAQFSGEQYGDEIAYEYLVRIIVQELNTGQFQVPVTLTTCGGIGITVNVPLLVVDFQIEVDGYEPNLRSTPVTLDPAWNTLADIMGDGIDDVAAFVGWDSTLGKWVEPGPDTVFTPLTSYYIIMEEDTYAQMRFVVERGITAPPTRALLPGWNLVASAPAWGYWVDEDDYYYEIAYPFAGMTPWDALYSVVEAPGGLTGWTQAVNPWEEEDVYEYFYYKGILLDKPEYWKDFDVWGWEVNVSDEWDYEYITPCAGYWVFMNNSDLLAGYSYTPVPLTVFKMIK